MKVNIMTQVAQTNQVQDQLQEDILLELSMDFIAQFYPEAVDEDVEVLQK